MSYKLPPLAEDCPETIAHGVTRKRWGFSGKALLQTDVDNLTAQGVDWVGDCMPDGRLKHPFHRKDTQARGKRENRRPKTRKVMLSDAEFAEKFHQWQEEWAALGDDRPDFITWFANHKTDEIGKQLLFDAFQSARSGGAAKSLGVLLEFGRMKPRQQIENVGERTVPATPEQLLDVFSQVFNIPKEKVNELLANLPKQ